MHGTAKTPTPTPTIPNVPPPIYETTTLPHASWCSTHDAGLHDTPTCNCHRRHTHFMQVEALYTLRDNEPCKEPGTLLFTLSPDRTTILSLEAIDFLACPITLVPPFETIMRMTILDLLDPANAG